MPQPTASIEMSQISWTLQNFRQILKQCIVERDLWRGKTAHALYLKLLVPHSTYLSNHFILFYSKCGLLSSARRAFDRTQNPNVFTFNAILSAYAKMSLNHIAHQLFDKIPQPDLVSYNTLIASYSESGDTQKALSLFQELRVSDLDIDDFTFSSMITSCGLNSSLVRQLHSLAVSGGFDRYASVNNSLITYYGKSRLSVEAERVFHCTGESIRDEVSFNTMIAVYGKNGESSKALSLFREMARSGLRVDVFTLASVLTGLDPLVGVQFHAKLIKSGLNSNPHIGSGLIDLYSKLPDGVKRFITLFEEVSSPDLILWNCLISGFSRKPEFSAAAVDSFRKMLLSGRHVPDDSTLSSVIVACSNLPSPSQGRQVHSLAIKSENILATKILVGNALVTMYSRTGNLPDARKVFEKMTDRNEVTLNSIIAAYSRHGNGAESLRLFDQMVQSHMVPTSVTFVSVLSACAHTGKVNEGLSYFNKMKTEFGIEPESEHYSCLIDLLGRAGRLNEAQNLIQMMPFEPSLSAWAALLGACKKYGNVDLGLKAAEKIIDLDPSNALPYVTLANIYTSLGKWEEVKKIRKVMRDRGVRKKPGCSWIEVNKRVHYFVAEDSSHPMIREIHDYLDEIMIKIGRSGYVMDVRWAMVKDDEAVEGESTVRLGHHSEKLAVAFGLMMSKNGDPIMVAKNLRICGDCHEAVKFMAAVTGREITVRDNHRFHCFKDGHCSCGDFW